MHLVDAVGDAHGRCRRVHGLDRREIGSAERAQDVQCVVGHLAQHPGHGELHRRDVGAGLERRGLVDLPGGLEHEQPEHLDRGVGLGDLLLHHLVLGDQTAVRLAAERPFAHHVEGELALGDSAHGVVDAAAAEAALGEYLGAVFRAEQVVRGYPDVTVDDVIVVPRLRHDLDARGGAGHHEHAVGAHHEQEVGDPSGRGEPLLAVDYPLIAVPFGMGPEQVRVAATLRFGHRVGREHVLVEQRLEPPLLLLLGAVGREDLHVPGIGCRRAEHRRCPGVAADHLVEQSQPELPEAWAAQLPVEEDRPQALVLDLKLELTDVRLDRVWPAHGMGEDVVERLDLLLAEPLDPVELVLELRIGGEVPRHALTPCRLMPYQLPWQERPRWSRWFHCDGSRIGRKAAPGVRASPLGHRPPSRSASRAASARTTRLPAEPGSRDSAGAWSLAAKPSSAMCPAR